MMQQWSKIKTKAADTILPIQRRTKLINLDLRGQNLCNSADVITDLF